MSANVAKLERPATQIAAEVPALGLWLDALPRAAACRCDGQVFVNDLMEELTGYDREALTGAETWSAMALPAGFNLADIRAPTDAALAAAESSVVPLLKRDGDRCMVEIVRRVQGPYEIWLFTDLTEDVRVGLVNLPPDATDTTDNDTAQSAESARIHLAERRLRDAVESVNAGFVLWNADGRMELCNNEFATLSPTVQRTIAPGITLRTLLQAAAKAGELAIDTNFDAWWASYENMVAQADVSVSEMQLGDRWLLVSERPTSDGGRVSVYTDISILKRKEELLRSNEDTLNVTIQDLEKSRLRIEEQSQRLAEIAEMYQAEHEKANLANEAKSQFLAVMSHELRTPMTGVMGVIDLLERTQLTSTQARYIVTLRASADALLSLLNDILDFSKIEAGRMTIEEISFDVNEVCTNVEQLFREKASSRENMLTLKVDDDVPANVIGDPARLRQVLSNLVGNAVKFTEHGTVTLQVSMADSQPNNGAALLFCVDDTGIGLTDEQCSRLFRAFEQADPTTTRKFGGTGLGLAICRRLVELMGGEIGVESEPGRGSRFWFTVPVQLCEAASPQPREPEAPSEPSPNATKVLLAEDNAVNRMLIISMLNEFGYEVDAVEDGDAAVSMMRERPDFDIVLMDMQMPNMDGKTAAEEIRKLPAPACNIPIVALTANVSPTHRDAYLRAGLDGFLAKPIEWDQLDATVRQLVDKASGDDAAPQPETSSVASLVAEFDSLPLINHETIGHIADMVGEASLSSMITMMVASVRGELEKAQTALDAGDLDSVSAVAHSLKGVAANFGAERLAAVASQLQHHQDHAASPADLIAALCQVIEATDQAFVARLD